MQENPPFSLAGISDQILPVVLRAIINNMGGPFPYY